MAQLKQSTVLSLTSDGVLVKFQPSIRGLGMTTELWKPVVGHEDLYEVSDEGRIRSVKTGRILRTFDADKFGHQVLTLSRSGVYQQKYVHVLALEAFVSPRPLGMETRHFPDRDPKNNRLNNLSWSTPSQNQMDRVAHGTSNRGEQHGLSLLTKEQAIYIINSPKTQPELAKELHVSQRVISDIQSGRRWEYLPRNVSPDILKERKRRAYLSHSKRGGKLTEKLAAEIRSKLELSGNERGMARKLSREYGVSEAIISMIKKNKIWSHAKDGDE